MSRDPLSCLLPDGGYDLTVHSSLVTVNSTSTSLSGPDQVYSFYRLFGDIYGRGTIGSAEYDAMLAAYGHSVGNPHYNAALDYNGTGTIGLGAYDAIGSDYGQSQPGFFTLDMYYSSQSQVVEEDQSGEAQAEYVWSPVYVNALIERDDQPDGYGDMNRRLYATQDANWNTTALIDTSGTVVERYQYDPYGGVTIMDSSFTPISGNTSAYNMVYLFQGMRYDPVTGMYHADARDENPNTAVWEEQDPAGYVNGASLYQYVASNPVQFEDPSGLAFSQYPEGPYEPDDYFPPSRDELTDALTATLGNNPCPKCVQEASDMANAIESAVAQNAKLLPPIFGSNWGNDVGILGVHLCSLENTCQQWQAIIAGALLPVEQQAGASGCLQGYWENRPAGAGGGGEHHWIEIDGPNGTVNIDPWPSGGSDIIDNSAVGGSQTHDPVYRAPKPPKNAPTTCPNKCGQ